MNADGPRAYSRIERQGPVIKDLLLLSDILLRDYRCIGVGLPEDTGVQ